MGGSDVSSSATGVRDHPSVANANHVSQQKLA
jgi:hypothetical protein